MVKQCRSCETVLSPYEGGLVGICSECFDRFLERKEEEREQQEEDGIVV